MSETIRRIPKADPMPIVEPEDCYPEYAPHNVFTMPEDVRAETFPDLTEELISERETTHGDFSDNSWVSQGLKEVIRSYEESNTHRLTRLHRDALDMIFAKVGRIVAGNPNFQDHWDDIAGYARLVSQRV